MKGVDDFIRSFGMSGLLISEELKAAEQKFGIQVGHTPPVAARNPLEYYPQFEQSVRAEATEMAMHYELFYCLETSIRKLISETLAESAGDGWWDSGKVPANIVQGVSERAQREINSGVTRRSDRPIDYTTFGELSVIINTNWEIFATIFTSRQAVEKVMGSLNLLRGPIAHCCPITDDEVVRLGLAVRDWFRMMG